MQLKLLIHLATLFAVISILDAWTLTDTNIYKDVVYNHSEGYDVTDQNTYNNKKRRGFCELATTEGSPLFQKNEMLQGDFYKEVLNVGQSINIYAVKCTTKYKGNQELWLGKGPKPKTVAVYTKSIGGTGVLIGAMADFDDNQLPGQ